MPFLEQLRCNEKNYRLIINNIFINRLRPISKFRLYNTSSNKNATALSKNVISKNSFKYHTGDELNGFLLTEASDIPELHLIAYRLKHIKTGADYLHIDRKDKNNLFSIAFRTPPPDNSGVCHILEHLALCGSKDFPCRDPFFKMISRSLQTFMNAFTGYDYTMYPFSSQNFQDFNNLMRVYLDAAFFPNLRKEDFLQEGWRLEHETLKNPQTPLIFKGVVFNEMKGVFASSAHHFYQKLHNELYPKNSYGFVSGGDPLYIPNLEWSFLRDYHRTFYHPSNARFFSYGSFPLESHLENVNNYVLSKFEKTVPNSSVSSHPRWTEPQKETITCAPDPLAPDPDKQTTVAIAFSLCNIKDSNEVFTLEILGKLLTDGSSSPFYQSLIAPGIGSDYAPGVGYIGHTLESSFSVGLCGINEKDVDKVTKIIDDTLDEVIQVGFPKNRIEAVLHGIELGCKYQTSKFGLSLLMYLNPVWNHEGDPLNSLRINKQVEWFKKQLENDHQFLQKKVKQYFKDNTHKLTLKMSPDANFSRVLAQKEEKLLRSKISSLSEKDKKAIYEESLLLAQKQSENEGLSSLPTLLVSQVEPTIESTTTCVESVISEAPVFAYREATNGLVYFRGITSASPIPNALQEYLPIFCSVVTSMGTKTLNYMDQDEEIALCTGGLNASVHLVSHPDKTDSIELGVLFSSHCLERNTQRMFALWKDIFEKVQFEDTERLAQLIRIEASDLVQDLSFSTHSYAVKYAGSNLTAGSRLAETFSGITRVKHQKQLAELNNFEQLAKKLKEIAAIILSKDAARFSLHTTNEFQAEGLNLLDNYLNTLKRGDRDVKHGFQPTKFNPSSELTHFCMPVSVNFLAEAIHTVNYNHPDFPRLRILSTLLSRKFLHSEIREQGGAYISGSNLNGAGIFTLYSGRDPNSSKTLEAFSRGVAWAQSGDFSSLDIDEAKLGVFSEIDYPVTPAEKGLQYFLNGITDEMRQQHKNRIFAATKDDIVIAARQYFSENVNRGIVLIGPENDYTKSRGWKIVNE